MPRVARTVTASTRTRCSVHARTASQTLSMLRPGSLTLLLTDPPYQTVNRHGSDHLQRWFRGSMTWPQIGRVLAMARRRMTTDGLAMVLVNEAGLPSAQTAVRQAGFARQRLVVWDQRAPGLGTGLRHQVAYVVIGLQPGSRSLVGRDLLSVSSVGPGTKGRYPTEKPVELGRRLAAMARIDRRDLVVDPFCGSGNLLVAAVERGARVIAGDTSARAVSLATRRLSRAAAGKPSTAKAGALPATARGRPLLDGRRSKATAPLRSSARRTPARRSVARRPAPKRRRR